MKRFWMVPGPEPWIEFLLAGPLELLHKDESSSSSAQDCSGATMQKHFLRRSSVLFSVTPLSLRDTSGVLLQRQQKSLAHMWTHTHTQTKQKKKRGCIRAKKLPRLDTNTSAQTDTCDPDGAAPHHWVTCLHDRGKHLDLLRHNSTTITAMFENTHSLGGIHWVITPNGWCAQDRHTSEGKTCNFHPPERSNAQKKNVRHMHVHADAHALSFSKKIIMIIEKESRVENVFGGNTARKTQAWKNSGKDKYSFRGKKGIHHSLKPNY